MTTPVYTTLKGVTVIFKNVMFKKCLKNILKYHWALKHYQELSTFDATMPNVS